MNSLCCTFLACVVIFWVVIILPFVLGVDLDTDEKQTQLHKQADKLRGAFRNVCGPLVSIFEGNGAFCAKATEVSMAQVSRAFAIANVPLVNVYCSGQKTLRAQKFAQMLADADDIAFLEFDLRSVLKSSRGIAGIVEPAAVFAFGCNDLFADQPLRQLNVRNYVHSWQHHPGEKFGGVAWTQPLRNRKDERPSRLLVTEAKFYNNSKAAAEASCHRSSKYRHKPPRKVSTFKTYASQMRGAMQWIADNVRLSSFDELVFEARYVGTQTSDVAEAVDQHAVLMKQAMSSCVLNVVPMRVLVANNAKAAAMLRRALHPAPRAKVLYAGHRNAWAAAWQALGITNRFVCRHTVAAATKVSNDGEWFVDTTFSSTKAETHLDRLQWCMQHVEFDVIDTEGHYLFEVRDRKHNKVVASAPRVLEVMKRISEDASITKRSLRTSLLSRSAKWMSDEEQRQWLVEAVKISPDGGSFTVKVLRGSCPHIRGSSLTELSQAAATNDVNVVHDLQLLTGPESNPSELRDSRRQRILQRSPTGTAIRWSTEDEQKLLAGIAAADISRNASGDVRIDWRQPSPVPRRSLAACRSYWKRMTETVHDIVLYEQNSRFARAQREYGLQPAHHTANALLYYQQRIVLAAQRCGLKGPDFGETLRTVCTGAQRRKSGRRTAQHAVRNVASTATTSPPAHEPGDAVAAAFREQFNEWLDEDVPRTAHEGRKRPHMRVRVRVRVGLG